MPRRALFEAPHAHDDAGVVTPTWASTIFTNTHDQPAWATAAPVASTSRLAPKPQVATSWPKTDVALPVASSSTAHAATPAINVAQSSSTPSTGTSNYVDILPALASLESALHGAPTALAQPLDVLSAATNLLSATTLLSPPLGLVTSLLDAHMPTPTRLSSSTAPTSSSSTSNAPVPSATKAHTMAPAVHTSIVAVLATGAVAVVFFGGLAAWHSFRKSRRRSRHSLAPSPVFGGTTPRSFGPYDEEKLASGSWQTFEEREGVVASASAANDLAHQRQVSPPKLPSTGMTAVGTPNILQALAPAKLRVRNADIGKPMRIGLGYETHSIHVPTTPAPKPPSPAAPFPFPLPLPTFIVASASQTSARLGESNSGNMSGVGSSISAEQPLARSVSHKAQERPLTERQTKVLTSALGLASPPSPTFDLDLYRYTRYGLEEAHSEYAPSPPLPSTSALGDASPNSALGQLMLDCAQTPVVPAPPQTHSQSSSEKSLATPLPASYTQSSSSPGLPYLSSVWTVEEPREPTTMPLKVARKDTRGGKKHRVKRASLLPRLDFPLPPTTVPPPPSQRQLDFWDEAVRRDVPTFISFA